LAVGAVVAVFGSACLGSGSAGTVAAKHTPKLVTHPGPPSERAWVAMFAAQEAATLGDPLVKTALVAPITADQARVVFQHRRRAYPGHTFLVVLHGSFVTPRVPCPPAAGGCFYVPQLFGWQITLARQGLGRAWRYFGIETDAPHLRAMPVALRRISLETSPWKRPTGALLRFAAGQAMRMGGSQIRDFGFAPVSSAQASQLFGGSRPRGYLVIEHGLFRRSPGAPADRDPWFAWAALEYRPSDQRPAAFRVLARPRRFVRRAPGIHVSWQGPPVLAGVGRSFYWGGG
jgi:hypothetical protein